MRFRFGTVLAAKAAARNRCRRIVRDLQNGGEVVRAHLHPDVLDDHHFVVFIVGAEMSMISFAISFGKTDRVSWTEMKLAGSKNIISIVTLS